MTSRSVPVLMLPIQARRTARGERASLGYVNARPGQPTAMAKTFEKGDKVEWDSHGGTAVGKVEKKITTNTDAGGRTVKASEDEPQYLVRSEKSGGTAVHKPDALRKR